MELRGTRSASARAFTALTAAILAVSALLPYTAVLCRAAGGHVAIESIASACCGPAAPADRCGGVKLVAMAAGSAAERSSGEPHCTDTALDAWALVRPARTGTTLLAATPAEAGGVMRADRGPAAVAPTFRHASGRAQVLAAIRATVLTT